MNDEVIKTFQKELLNNLISADSTNFIDASVNNFSLEYDEGNFTLKTFYTNGYASTSSLEEVNKALVVVGTSCASKSCSNSDTQCQPKGRKCTSCIGDCTRTTTSDCCLSCKTNVFYSDVILHYEGSYEALLEKYKPNDGYTTIRL